MPQFFRCFPWLLPYPYPYFLPVVPPGVNVLAWIFIFTLLCFLVLIYILDFWFPEHSVCALYCLSALIPSCLTSFDLLLRSDFLFLASYLHPDSGILTAASVLGTGSQGLPQDCLTLVLNPFPLSSDLPQLSRSWLPLCTHDTLPYMFPEAYNLVVLSPIPLPGHYQKQPVTEVYILNCVSTFVWTGGRKTQNVAS